MELFVLLFIMMCLSPVGVIVGKRLTPQIKAGYVHKKALDRIAKRRLELESATAKHQDKLLSERSEHIQELNRFDTQIKEIERPAIRRMVEKRVIESSTVEMSNDREYWLNEKYLIQSDFEHIRKIAASDPTETDVLLMRGLADRMGVVERNLSRLDREKAQKEKLEREQLKAPAELFDFLETVNDPDVDAIRQMKATQRFVGATCRTEDIYYGRITADDLMNMAQKKVDRYLAMPNFGDLMQREALRRVNNSDNPNRLLELWGVSENFNNWVKVMDKHPDNH